ncbi:hypothetical protein [Acinetobacter rudis]|uniref:hypothetical protein n=1 Tax=Acinetobacter rudis TaxID=632955 RepID=UPI003342AD1A
MDALIAASATIQGAQIQANYALWAAVIGAVAVWFTIICTAQNTVKHIKAEKVAELKRDQYVAWIDAYTRFSVSAEIFILKNHHDLDAAWDQHLAKYIELIGCIGKVGLITTSNIRVELYKIEKELKEYQKTIANYYCNKVVPSSGSDKELKSSTSKFIELLREDLGVKSDPEIEHELAKKRKN